MTSYLKRLNAPRTWSILRKERTYTLRPNAGSQKLSLGLPIGTLIRDYLKFVKNGNELRKMLRRTTVQVNGRRQIEGNYFVGIFDVLEIPDMKKTYRLTMSRSNKLKLIEIPAAEHKLFLSRVQNKTLLKGGKLQINLWDGRNLLVENQKKNDFDSGSSVVLTTPDNKVHEVLKLEKGNMIFLVEGKHAGRMGRLEAVSGKKILFKDTSNNVYETLKDYVIVIGTKEPAITVVEDMA